MTHSGVRYTEVLDQAVSDRKGIRKPEPLAQRVRWIPVQTHRQPPPPRPLDRQWRAIRPRRLLPLPLRRI